MHCLIITLFFRGAFREIADSSNHLSLVTCYALFRPHTRTEPIFQVYQPFDIVDFYSAGWLAALGKLTL